MARHEKLCLRFAVSSKPWIRHRNVAYIVREAVPHASMDAPQDVRRMLEGPTTTRIVALVEHVKLSVIKRKPERISQSPCYELHRPATRPHSHDR